MNYHKFFSQLDKLRDVPRFSTYPLYKENVAEHSYYVALFTMLMARRLKEQGIGIDAAKAMSFALMHDAEESFLGDVLYDTKQKLNGTYDTAAHNVVFDWANEVDGLSPGPVYGLWRWAKHYNTLEGRVVALADELALLLVLIRQKDKYEANNLARKVQDKIEAVLKNEAEPALVAITNDIRRRLV